VAGAALVVPIAAFYVAVALLVVANGLMTANWFILASGLTVFFLLVIRTSIEEAKLVERFGQQYRDYMGKTGRFWPKRWTRGSGSS
jgi:protein-S-isoprenylcysteine O-methyltransferase Ste14